MDFMGGAMGVDGRTTAGPSQSSFASKFPYGSQAWGVLVRDLLARGRTATFTVRGVSMLPTLREGDRVSLKHLGDKPAQAGDIVAFMRGPVLCLHRVLAVVHDGRTGRITYYLTAGDGLLAHDGRQPAEAIVGKVVRVQGPRGDWSPDSLLRRAQGRARSFLGLHPRLRSQLRSVKRAFRNLGLAGRANEGAGVDL